jgi:hypothetical protein
MRKLNCSARSAGVTSRARGSWSNRKLCVAIDRPLTRSRTSYVPGVASGPCVPAAHMINPWKLDASGYRMFQTKLLTPARFGARGTDGVRGASSSVVTGPGASGETRVSFWMLSCESPVARRLSSRERRPCSRRTESA